MREKKELTDQKEDVCVGRQQEGKSGQQRVEVKATLLLGADAAGRLAVKKRARAFGDLEAT